VPFRRSAAIAGVLVVNALHAIGVVVKFLDISGFRLAISVECVAPAFIFRAVLQPY
jgi:hypothetical protein